MQTLKKVLLGVVGIGGLVFLAFFGLLFWSEIRTELIYGHEVETDAAFLEQRLCRLKSSKERVALCEKYERRISNAVVYCYAVDKEDLGGNHLPKGDTGLRVVVDYNRYENFDEDYRPVICK